MKTFLITVACGESKDHKDEYSVEAPNMWAALVVFEHQYPFARALAQEISVTERV